MALAYDSARHVTVMFGGYSGEQMLSDTWEWDGSEWVERFPQAAPSARSGASAVFDADNNIVLLFGGPQDPAPMGDLWAWDGSNWSRRYSANGPRVRASASTAYDSVRHRMVLFGGLSELLPVYSDAGVWTGNGASFYADTWEWNGANWNQRVVEGPSGRYLAGTAFDIARGKTVIFGGYSGMSAFDGTWEWDGSSWSNPELPVQPPNRAAHAQAYDTARNVVVLFGGGVTSDGTQFLSDTWEYKGQ